MILSQQTENQIKAMITGDNELKLPKVDMEGTSIHTLSADEGLVVEELERFELVDRSVEGGMRVFRLNPSGLSLGVSFFLKPAESQKSPSA